MRSGLKHVYSHVTSKGREYGLIIYLYAHSHIIKDTRAVPEAQVAHQEQHNQTSDQGVINH